MSAAASCGFCSLLLALNAGRVVPAGSLAGQIWPDDPPGNPR
jgi:hypothetical protein